MFSLSKELQRRPVVLVFYIYDFSPVCTDQLCEVNDMEYFTLNDDVTVFGISGDGPYSHREFAKQNSLTYPLLSDGRREVYQQYGMIEQTDDGKPQLRRGIVVVDTDQTVRFRWTAENNLDKWRIDPLTDANSIVQNILDRS